MVIPNQSTNEGQEHGAQDPDPGRGGSADLGAGGAGGASHQPPENFGQRVTRAVASAQKIAQKIADKISPKGPEPMALLAEKNDATPAQASPFLYGETELSAVTGIVLKSLQKKRATKLTQGLDWDLNGLRVAYSSVGLVAIMTAVTGKALEVLADGLYEIAGVKLAELQEKTRIPLPSTKKPEPGAAAPTPGKGPDVRTGCVRRFFTNPYIMELELEPLTKTEDEDEKEGKEVVIVRVKATKNFRRGMAVPLRFDERSGRYELARRLPRFPGKW